MIDLPMSDAGPLLRSDLLAAGLTEDELRRLRVAGLLTVLERGAYLRSSDPRLQNDLARHAVRVAAAVRRTAPGSVVSHVSAAVLHGLPVWGLPLQRVHLTRARRNGAVRTARLHVHPAPLEPGEIGQVGGIAVTGVARTVVDLARTAGFAQAVVTADAALHHHRAGRAELVEAVRRARGWPGAPAAHRVVTFADARSESPGESRSRVAIARAGLPAPVLQWEVAGLDGTRLGYADFWWPELGTVGEFDGRVKYGRLLRPGQDPGEVVFTEKVREDAIRATGRHVARWIWPELDGFGAVANRIHPPHRAS